jgi:hypothetical protein
MRVAALVCEGCTTEVKSSFRMPAFMDLSSEQQQFAVDFILASGSLKEIATKYGISYPTVRGRLDRIIERLQGRRPDEDERRASILDALEEKRITAAAASKLLKEAVEEGDTGVEGDGNG